MKTSRTGSKRLGTYHHKQSAITHEAAPSDCRAYTFFCDGSDAGAAFANMSAVMLEYQAMLSP